MQPGLVSIIIPTYNRAHLLADAIHSVLAQDYPHKQIIVVDDGSEDNTRQLVSAFAGVEYIYQTNQGQAAARNAGLRHCWGEYVASLDSDDVWDANFLSSGIEQLQPNINLVFMNWRADEQYNGMELFFRQAAAQQRYFTRAIGDWWYLNAAQSRRLMLETCPAPSSALIVRRNVMLGGWNEEMLIADDWCLLLDVVMQQPTAAAFTMVPRWLKRVQGDNICDGRNYIALAKELSFHDEPLLLQRHRAQLLWSEVSIFRQRQAKHHFHYAYASYKHAAKKAMFRHIAKAFRLAPLATSRNIVLEVAAYARNYYAKS
ncbi:glycosyltransferase family 2 protein [Hymenobacter negativus]|uniref:Glycosyltransferase family 2 protein n=1 Tax=Hymenobacter negativus TaxID=2795026 RepID=A0ABS0QBQ3_9BACT|nr:glycosyltransferase family 2 protein [Hymenobacter negativus]MBH8560005.1 glycosyltransferase family 2 protein [Hymenobacter negativus]